MKSNLVVLFSLCFLIIVNSSNAANSLFLLANKANSDQLKVMLNNGEMLSHINKEILNQITMQGNEELLFDITKRELIRENSVTSFSRNEQMPLLSITEKTPSIQEGDSGVTTMEFQISLSEISNDTVSVTFFTEDSSAISGEDFEGVETVVTFLPGETFKKVPVNIFGDTKYETDELFCAELKNPVNAELDLSGSVIKGYESIAKIINDDSAELPTLSITEKTPSIQEGDSGVTTMEFQISLSEISNDTVSVTFFTEDSSAISGEDFEGVETVVTFLPGETLKKVPVNIFGDTKYETDELFCAELKNPVNAELDLSGSVIKGYESIAKIINDDSAGLPTLSITEKTPSIQEGDSGVTTMEFQISLSEISNDTVSVTFFTEDSSAISGEDFEGVETVVTFLPGETLKKVPINIFGDTKYETDELFCAELKNPVNAELDLSGSVIRGYESIAKIINDDRVFNRVFNSAIINLLLSN